MRKPFIYQILIVVALPLFANLASALPTSNSGQAYIDECNAAGVPIPPDWGNSKWKFNEKIAAPIISQFSDAYVYYYESQSPKGVCMALPRVNGFGKVDLLGIICQGNESSKACFWDNSTFTLDSLGEKKALSEFTSGAALKNASGGECTACHAGENVFVIDPGTATDLSRIGVNTKPKDYVQPLVDKAWHQNDTPSTLDGACSSCHNQSIVGRLPELSTDIDLYCRNIMRTHYNRGTMPPPGSPGGDYEAHWDALFPACRKAPPSKPSAPRPTATLDAAKTWMISFF